MFADAAAAMPLFFLRHGAFDVADVTLRLSLMPACLRMLSRFRAPRVH